jgi:hypothetical protein
VQIELAGTASPAPSSGTAKTGVNFSPNCGGSGPSFHPSASISLTPSIEFDWSWGWLPPSLNGLHFAVVAAETSQVALAGDAKLTCSASGQLYYQFRDIRFNVGPVPVILTPELSMAGKAGATFSAQGSAGLSQTSQLKVGFDYQNGSFHLIGEKSNKFTPAHSPNVAVVGDVLGSPRLEIKFYGRGGPYVELNASAQVAATAYGGKIVASLQANAGIEFHIAVLNFDGSMKLFDPPLTKEFAWGSTPPVGDSCLPGTWTMSSEDNPSGWSFNGQVVHVKGLAGQVLIITPGGRDTVNWANSQPLVGTFQGRTLTILLRGTAAADVHGAAGLYSVSNITGAITAAFNWGGTPGSTGSVGLVGIQGLPYSCTATQLVVHYPGSVTDTYNRTG